MVLAAQKEINAFYAMAQELTPQLLAVVTSFVGIASTHLLKLNLSALSVVSHVYLKNLFWFIIIDNIKQMLKLSLLKQTRIF